MRFAAFIDILGFSNLINESNDNPDKAQSIYDALMTLHPSNARNDIAGHINAESIPESEIENVKNVFDLFAQTVVSKWDLRFSSFSDSVLISAPITIESACFAVIELLAKFTVKIFEQHDALIRGGVAIGNLVHDENGPVFGQALVDAYNLECEKARYPRILFGGKEGNAIKMTSAHEYMLPLILEDDSGCYISLGSAYMYLSTHSAYAQLNQTELVSGFFQSLKRMRELHQSYLGTRHEIKYSWALEDMERQAPHIASIRDVLTSQ